MEFISTKHLSKTKLTNFFIEHWGSPEMVISSGTFHCDELDGFAAIDERGKLIGLITYVIEKDECEIISLDSIIENKGIGSTLLKMVEKEANKHRCQRIKLITTNDNLHALGFYQKREYRLEKIYVRAVEKARKRKPDIPLIANNGIPIRDELLLVKRIDSDEQN
ncbi:GNAT family N-acetyltransferase [Fervidibacillus halotolerans]|uniref:GNAT family N-acetyltransferase n=1 Tax=Fervidibacillus halotolerans TaxID=2980027 RepID=A0A9E8LYS3_9BACI|nr:GNAT family N-acetyltransferase [Fervidibacillus halotolerans]WAA12268.1 GNAT family N-acetyltransferase [Fervidibacillus halotolerans]